VKKKKRREERGKFAKTVSKVYFCSELILKIHD